MHKYICTIIRRKEHFKGVKDVRKEKLADAMEKLGRKIWGWMHECVPKELWNKC